MTVNETIDFLKKQKKAGYGDYTLLARPINDKNGEYFKRGKPNNWGEQSYWEVMVEPKVMKVDNNYKFITLDTY